MATPIIMPKFEMTQEEATILRWLRREGDEVEKGEPVLEVETDKVVMEVEAPASGVLQGIRSQEGEVVPVTAVIAYVLQPGETLPAADEPAPPAPAQETPAPAPRTTPVARRYAEEAGVDLSQVPAPGASGRITRRDIDAYLARPAEPDRQAAETEPRPRATPAARRTARELGLDLAGIAGSGPRGRIQAADVQAAQAQEQVSPPPEKALPAAAGEPEVVPLQGKRRTIAARLQQSYQTAPHIMLTVEVDMSRVEALRQELNRVAEAGGVPRISVTAVLVKVCAWALQRHRWLNSSLRDDNIYLHPSAGIGVAVALEQGLIVPVIHQAGQLGLKEIAAQVQDLTNRARQDRLTPADVAGGTFTISNLGMYGIDHFTAIINPPQAAILAVGRIAKRVVVVERGGQDKLVVRPVMSMTLAADHRIVDGAVAAQFLQDVVKALEQPSLLLW